MKGEVFLDRYEVLGEVGQGGMAVVHRAVDRVLDRPVAIKVLHPHLAQKAEARSRFHREARVIARLRHPNVVEVYDYSGEDSERAFIIQEFVSGETLSSFLLRHGPMTPEVSALVVAAVARALEHAHSQGVIHRDVKPENLMVREDGVLKLMDFGIAHVVDMEHLTVSGAILGSPAHMSPEQVDGKALDARTDIFSLGTLFFQAATGRLPFTSDTAAGLLKAIAEARVPDVRTLCPGFPDDLARILARMMARDPADRYQTAAEVADALEGVTRPLGLEPAAIEVPRFFQRPKEQEAAVRRIVAAARLQRARDFLREGRFALAIRELDVTLANDPDNAEAHEVLRKARVAVRRSRVRRRVLWVAGLAGGCAVLVAVAVWVVGSRPPPVVEVLPEPEVGVPAPLVPPRVAPAPRTSARRGPERVAAWAVRGGSIPRKTERPNGRPPEPAPPDLVPIVIQANPPAVRITVDDRTMGTGTTGPVRLAPGRHVVTLSHPKCDVCRDATYEFTLDPAHPPRAPLRFSIGYLDALLVVRGPDGARVLVNGLPRGTTGRTLRIPMTRPDPVEVQVVVEVAGGPSRSARAVLAPGTTASVSLP